MLTGKEVLVSKTIEYRNKDVPKLVNKSAVAEIVKGYFNRSDPSLYEMLDPFFFATIEVMCEHMKTMGVKQPTADDFINAFKAVQGINLNIGNLHIDNYVPPEQLKKEIITEVMAFIEDKYLTKFIKPEQVADPKPAPKEEEEDFEAVMDKYAGVFQGPEGDVDEPRTDGSKTKESGKETE